MIGSREEGDATNLFNASGGYTTIGEDLPGVFRRGVIRDEAGRIFADIQASSRTDLRGNKKIDSSVIQGGYSHLHPGTNGIAFVAPFSGIMMQAGPKAVTITTAYEVMTEDGKVLHGFTFYPHYLPDQQKYLDTVQRLDMVSVEQSFNGRDLHIVTESVVRPAENYHPNPRSLEDVTV